VGLVSALLLARSDYHLWSRRLLRPIWFATILILLLVFTPFAGQDALGANRWINIGGFGLQPSEFAKITIVLTAANLAEGYFEEGSLAWREFVKLLAVGVAVPLALIIVQPDKGSTMVLGITIVVMGYLAGLPKRYLMGFLVAGLLAFFALSLKDDYSRQRFLTMLNPWADPYGTGYQLIQGFYAFASGGLLRRRHRLLQAEVLLPAHGPQRLHLRRHRRGVRAGGRAGASRGLRAVPLGGP
jgi:cell division protein FtsW